MLNSRESLRVVSLNIEGQRHLGRVNKFLTTASSDVVLLQEVFKEDAAAIAANLGMHHKFGVMCHRPLDYNRGDDHEWGVAMLAKSPMKAKLVYYGDDPENIPRMQLGPRGEPLISALRALIVGSVEKNNEQFNIATTHFTWSDNGEATDKQRTDVRSLLGLLEDVPEVALVGDFNSPRHGEIYKILAEHYNDGLPRHVTTTIDGKYHRAGFLQLVVDHLWTTPGYKAESVYVMNGLSDHWAIMTRIHKAEQD